MDAERVYVIAHDKAEAFAWARRNKPNMQPRFCSTSSPAQTLGKSFEGVSVYVLHPMDERTRSAWVRSGASLVYL